jgi:acyl-CoA thioester hydrolase
MMEFLYEKEFEVRDYELDLQGIVNNAVYHNYFEHARHSFIKTRGVDFADLHNRGIDAVVMKMETEYKAPLKSGDKFVCRLNISQEGMLKIIFHQHLYRLPDNKLMTSAKVTVVCVNSNGRPVEPSELKEKLGLE